MNLLKNWKSLYQERGGIDFELLDYGTLIPSVTRLKEVGVKFQKAESRNILNVKFNKGVLEITPLLITPLTETIFRNLIIFEQFSLLCMPRVTSYAILLDCLVDTSDDMHLMNREGILDNRFNLEETTNFLNRARDNTFTQELFYARLHKDVNEYCEKRWLRWRDSLIHNYFTKLSDRMRERGRERTRRDRDGQSSWARRTALNREHAESHGRSQQRRGEPAFMGRGSQYDDEKQEARRKRNNREMVTVAHNRSYVEVVKVHSMEMVQNLQEKFYMEGYFSCQIRAMGGKLVLLSCEDKEELKDLVEMASNWLRQCETEDHETWSTGSDSTMQDVEIDEKNEEEQVGYSTKEDDDVVPCMKEGVRRSSELARAHEMERGHIEDWIGKQLEEMSSKRKMRVRQCSLVYLETNVRDVRAKRKRERGKQSTQQMEGRPIPTFLPNPNGQVVGDSVGDSGIQNCNRSLKKQWQNKLAKEIWDLATQLGAVAEDDNEVIQRIEEMEVRDRQASLTMVNRDDEAHKKIRELVTKERIQFLAIQETKMEAVDGKICRSLWGTDDMEWVTKPSNGFIKKKKKKPSNGNSGGLLCVWNSKVLKKEEVIEGDNFIGVFGLWGAEKTPVYILNVYSPCQLASKRALWEELQGLINSRRGNWCLAGDYNTVRSVEERVGCTVTTNEMREFDAFIHNTRLIDLLLVGRKYTWYNSNGQYMSRIDRFLLSKEWTTKWSDVKQWGWRRSISDHCPVLLKNECVDWGPKPFKYYDAWLEQPGCKEVITNAWINNEVSGWNGFKLKEKLKRTKQVLKEWSYQMNTEMDNKIKEAETVIATIDEKREHNRLSATDEAMVKEGDANTKFFHKCVKGRWRRNEISSIRINGKQHIEVEEIKEGVAKYFQQMFAEEKWKRPKLDGISFKQITKEDNELLTAALSEQEIKEAIWNCDSSKAPGPDGFNFKFIKMMWEVLSKIIEEQQMAFIKGRQLVDGVVIANEVIDEAKRKKKKCSLFKVDFEKAYDRVCWEFIDYMMMRMGFSSTWRKWIQECLKSSSVLVLINGSPTKQFLVNRGIHQGDLLSPFLFLIVAEGLNGLVSSAVEKERYKGVPIGSGDIMVTHLQFADDTVLFREASKENI
ncbi:hypothetical protein SLEP1_g51682 [Rubroshorea leprosula]|uniref:Reverse transcriptase domain-containing protein n=1 Tax=Rubroshorea leprosula TaxID=152421 RepID=A0AAV5M453_9ROSI|nr:hypothetical protein SLEP1_g51682 [Rubroshorea leprosula]